MAEAATVAREEQPSTGDGTGHADGQALACTSPRAPSASAPSRPRPPDEGCTPMYCQAALLPGRSAAMPPTARHAPALKSAHLPRTRPRAPYSYAPSSPARPEANACRSVARPPFCHAAILPGRRSRRTKAAAARQGTPATTEAPAEARTAAPSWWQQDGPARPEVNACRSVARPLFCHAAILPGRRSRRTKTAAARQGTPATTVAPAEARTAAPSWWQQDGRSRRPPRRERRETAAAAERPANLKRTSHAARKFASTSERRILHAGGSCAPERKRQGSREPADGSPHPDQRLREKRS